MVILRAPQLCDLSLIQEVGCHSRVHAQGHVPPRLAEVTVVAACHLVY